MTEGRAEVRSPWKTKEGEIRLEQSRPKKERDGEVETKYTTTHTHVHARKKKNKLSATAVRRCLAALQEAPRWTDGQTDGMIELLFGTGDVLPTLIPQPSARQPSIAAVVSDDVNYARDYFSRRETRAERIVSGAPGRSLPGR